MSLRLDVKVIFSLHASKEHANHIALFTIPYIQAHIKSWHMANARKKTYHVLGSRCRIGNGSEIS
jgi:hypothetical protein